MHYQNITGIVAAVILLLEAILRFNAWTKLKKEDPYSAMKKELLLQRIIIDVLAIIVIFRNTSIYIYI